MDPSELAIHTFTTKPWSISECIENYARAGIGGISIWRETVAGTDLRAVRHHLDDSGLRKVSLVRGGFFTGSTAAARAAAMETNRQAIQDCATLGLPMLVMVCGATPGMSPAENFAQIRDGLGALTPFAADLGIKLAVEPLHPMYAADRSAITTMRAANDLCDAVNHPLVGVALDVFHVWWDLDLEEQTRRCAAAGRLFAYHICDWKQSMDDFLLDRGLPGEGVIPLRAIDTLVRSTGFTGLAEVEIFSRKWWSENQHHHLDTIISNCRRVYAP